jgi:carbohydrate diacid regulator
MISNQILQNTIDGIKSIARLDLCVIDPDGKVTATTFPQTEGCEEAAVVFAASPADNQTIKDFQFFKVMDDDRMEYILVARGDGEEAFMVGKMATFQLQGLIAAYKKRFDKDNFIKNLLLDNMLRVDIYTKAKKLHIDAEARRVVFIIETKVEHDNNALEVVRSLFATRPKDFITAVDEKNIILVREVKDDETLDDLDKTAEMLIDMLGSEAMNLAKIAYGTIVGDIREVSRSYKEAQLALYVGKIFYSEKNVIAYGRLGIGRLIYQLPVPLCQMFIKEIFDGKSPDDLDEETLATIDMFFNNSLNVSETSRQLFIHRNTLVYRLDKLQKSTGLDLRNFDDAITFKIAMMVVKYMKYVESRESF